MVHGDRPIVITDTSWFVDYGMNDLGAISKLDAIQRKLPSVDTEVIVPERIAREYIRMYEASSCNEYGIPRTTSYYARKMQDWSRSDEPMHEMMAAWSVWKDNSRKADRGVRLSLADQSVLAHTIQEAKDGRECYILSGDEDITGPGKALHEMFPNSYVPEEISISLEDANKRSLTINPNPSTPIMLLPEALGMLYGISASLQPEYYLLCAKVPFRDKSREVGISVHPLDSSFSFVGSDTMRYPVLTMDIQDMYDGSEQTTEMLGRTINSRFMRMDDALRKRFSTFHAIEIVRSRRHGLLELTKYEKQVEVKRNRLYPAEKSMNFPWFLIKSGYIGKFAPETGHALADFYGNHYEEMRTALAVGTRA